MILFPFVILRDRVFFPRDPTCFVILLVRTVFSLVILPASCSCLLVTPFSFVILRVRVLLAILRARVFLPRDPACFSRAPASSCFPL